MSDSRFQGIFQALLKEREVPTVQDKHEEQEQNEVQEKDPVAVPPLQKGQIAVDVIEDGSYIVIKSLIAGVKLSDLDIDVSDNKITIRGSRELADDLANATLLVQECYYGDFERTVELPHSVNPGKVRATFSKDCVLKVFVPKEDHKVKIVKINEGG